MLLFEVFIPSSTPSGLDITARIRAESWIEALRNGLARLGDVADVRNIMVDITETGMVVSEPRSGRVFRIREVVDPSVVLDPPPPAAASAVAAPLDSPPPPAREPPPALNAPPPAYVLGSPPPLAPEDAALVTGDSIGLPVPPRFADGSGEEVSFVARPRTDVLEPEAPQGRPKSLPLSRVDELFGELFTRTQDLTGCADVTQAATLILDLALESVPSESGSVLIADISGTELTFAAARGPKADAVMQFRVPMGHGIVGFCAREGVSLAVSDAQRDPRFYARIAEALGYATQSILCAPAQIDGRVFGAIELINREGGTSFTDEEVNVLNYLALQFAEHLASLGRTGD